MGGLNKRGSNFECEKALSWPLLSRKVDLYYSTLYKKSYLTYLFAALTNKTGTKIMPTLGNTTFLSSKVEKCSQINKPGSKKGAR